MLNDAVAGAAAFRRRRRLQPAGGPGDKIFPPTYPGEGNNAPPRHVFERRRISGQDIACVLIDSVQSQANRLEEALLTAARSGAIELPRVVVDFTGRGIDNVGEISSLDAPHRIFDAILRDSLLDGIAFRQSGIGIRLRQATMQDASAILEISPTALLFGAWNSTGEGGGLGARFARAIVSEIVGVGAAVEYVHDTNTRRGEARGGNSDLAVYVSVADARGAPADELRTAARRTGSRIDPLGIIKSVEVFKSGTDWDIDSKTLGPNAKKVKPSEINHGNIKPTVQALGVTCDYAEQTAVITLAGLRRLRFGGSPERDQAGRTLLAALGLFALMECDRQGYALRSRCDLVCDGHAPLQLVACDGVTTDFALDADIAGQLYRQALEQARDAGFNLPSQPTRLVPQDKLVTIVRKSQDKALRDEAETEDAG